MIKIRKKIEKIVLIITVLYFVWFSYSHLAPKAKIKQITYKGFGWYGELADDKLNERSFQLIKELGGNSVNINVYYEHDLKNESFILLSNLTKIEEKIELAHKNNLKVFLSPFVNLVGGHPTANMIENPDKFLGGAKNISIELARFAQKNDVEIYAVWNELGLALYKKQNSANITNEWLQNTKEEVREVYKGILTTKEGVQLGLYENYNFSGFDCIGLTFYPFTTSFAKDPYTNITYAGVEGLEEYEKVVKQELSKIEELKKKFNSKCIILGEIGIDVVGGKFVGYDEDGKRIRAISYEIILKNVGDLINGFFFSKFEHKNGGSEELDNIFFKYFNLSN